MSQAILIPAIIAGFAIVFPAMWLGITGLLSGIAGWSALERAFPDRPEMPVETLTMQSARMRGVNYSSCLRFDICASGLRVSVMKLLGPFSKPFFVPWGQIGAKPVRIFFFDYVMLTFGTRGEGSMAVGQRAFGRMAAVGNLKLD